MGVTREDLIAKVGGLESFERRFSNRTHFPERAAKNQLDGGVEYLATGEANVRAAGGDDTLVAEWQQRFVKLWLAYQAAGARTASSMITGPANFPVERNRKRLDTEHKRMGEMLAHADGAREFVRRRLRSAERAQASVAAAQVEHEEREVAGVRLVKNTTLDRVQLVFPGKPDPDTIKELKSRAFRWSPREGAWQRQLTRNGWWAAEAVLKTLTAEEAAA